MWSNLTDRVEDFWVVIPCTVAVGYQRFGGPYCLHLQGDMRSTDIDPGCIAADYLSGPCGYGAESCVELMTTISL
jgi:hypothetical protein